MPDERPFQCPSCLKNVCNNTEDGLESTLPSFEFARDGLFTWGESSCKDLKLEIHEAYEKVVYWRKNLFKLPSGAAGKKVISNMTDLVNQWTMKGPMEAFALEAFFVLPPLLLQKPHAKSKTKDHIKILTSRLAKWECGKVSELLREGEEIQKQLQGNTQQRSVAQEHKVFAKLMMEGKISSAINFLGDKSKGGVLETTPDVLSSLIEKHPKAEPLKLDAMLRGPIDVLSHLSFEDISGEDIFKAALNTSGSAGPSGLDALGLRRMCNRLTLTLVFLIQNQPET